MAFMRWRRRSMRLWPVNEWKRTNKENGSEDQSPAWRPLGSNIYVLRDKPRSENCERRKGDFRIRHKSASAGKHHYSKVAICGMHCWEWANVHAAAVALSHQAPKYLHILQGGTT